MENSEKKEIRMEIANRYRGIYLLLALTIVTAVVAIALDYVSMFGFEAVPNVDDLAAAGEIPQDLARAIHCNNMVMTFAAVLINLAIMTAVISRFETTEVLDTIRKRQNH